MTIKEAILKSLQEIGKPATHWDVLNHIQAHGYYLFEKARTPESTISALLGDFIRKGDSRVGRIKGDNGRYLYYLTEQENTIVSRPQDTLLTNEPEHYHERDLHKLFATYLKSKGYYAKTIYHEQSGRKDANQKWIHPDMIGVSFSKYKDKTTQKLIRHFDISKRIKLTSYELKKEIRTDTQLKEAYFQALSNSSWAHFGYLVAFEIDDNLKEEIERLNQSFGIGVIVLNAYPYESKTLVAAKEKELDFITIDKLSSINDDFRRFMEYLNELLTTEGVNYERAFKEFSGEFCDDYFQNDADIETYCKEKHIPYEDENNE